MHLHPVLIKVDACTYVIVIAPCTSIFLEIFSWLVIKT